MENRVTIQDIADSLGLSRNTVSKAINNTGVLADSTRQKILARAIEMGYKQFSYLDLDTVQNSLTPPAPAKNEIALITTWFLNGSHFSAMMLDKFQMEISKRGYSMTMHFARAEDIAAQRLPASLRLENCAAIICIEVFDPSYARFICQSGVPVLFVDAPADPGADPLPADILTMNNDEGICQFIHLTVTILIPDIDACIHLGHLYADIQGRQHQQQYKNLYHKHNDLKLSPLPCRALFLFLGCHNYFLSL